MSKWVDVWEWLGRNSRVRKQKIELPTGDGPHYDPPGIHLALRWGKIEVKDDNAHDGRAAYTPQQQDAIVEELFRLEGQPFAPTREEFARSKGISDRTLRNYITKHESK